MQSRVNKKFYVGFSMTLLGSIMGCNSAENSPQQMTSNGQQQQNTQQQQTGHPIQPTSWLSQHPEFHGEWKLVGAECVNTDGSQKPIDFKDEKKFQLILTDLYDHHLQDKTEANKLTNNTPLWPTEVTKKVSWHTKDPKKESDPQKNSELTSFALSIDSQTLKTFSIHHAIEVLSDIGDTQWKKPALFPYDLEEKQKTKKLLESLSSETAQALFEKRISKQGDTLSLLIIPDDSRSKTLKTCTNPTQENLKLKFEKPPQNLTDFQKNDLVGTWKVTAWYSGKNPPDNLTPKTIDFNFSQNKDGKNMDAQVVIAQYLFDNEAREKLRKLSQIGTPNSLNTNKQEDIWKTVGEINTKQNSTASMELRISDQQAEWVRKPQASSAPEAVLQTLNYNQFKDLFQDEMHLFSNLEKNKRWIQFNHQSACKNTGARECIGVAFKNGQIVSTYGTAINEPGNHFYLVLTRQE